MKYQAKLKIEYLSYKCSNCGMNLPFGEMTEVPEKFGNGSIKITYLCKKCKEELEGVVPN